MSISKVKLQTIQKAAEQAKKASEAMQDSTKNLSTKLAKALADNPFNFGGVSQADLSVGKELSDLTKRLKAAALEVQAIYDAAHAMATTGSVRRTAPAAERKKPAKKAPTARAQTLKPGSNTAKLLAVLNTTLKADEFLRMNQTLVSKTSGVPLGSMTAALRRLTQIGAIVMNERGNFKLGAASAPKTQQETASRPATVTVAKAVIKKAAKKKVAAKPAVAVKPKKPVPIKKAAKRKVLSPAAAAKKAVVEPPAVETPAPVVSEPVAASTVNA